MNDAVHPSLWTYKSVLGQIPLEVELEHELGCVWLFGERETKWKGGQSQARTGSGKIKLRPNWKWSLESCPALRQGCGAFKLLVPAVVSFVVMVVEGACEVVAGRPREVSVGCTGHGVEGTGRPQADLQGQNIDALGCGSVQFSSVAQSWLTLPPTDCSTPGLPVHHQLPEFTRTHVHWVGDAIQPSHLLSSPSTEFDLFQHQGLFQWVSSSHQVAISWGVDGCGQIALAIGCVDEHSYQQHLRVPVSTGSHQINLLLNFWIFCSSDGLKKATWVVSICTSQNEKSWAYFHILKKYMINPPPLPWTVHIPLLIFLLGLLVCLFCF